VQEGKGLEAVTNCKADKWDVLPRYACRGCEFGLDRWRW
jgi:hypothetical protein